MAVMFVSPLFDEAKSRVKCEITYKKPSLSESAERANQQRGQDNT